MVREAVLHCFLEPFPVSCLRLRHLSIREWKRLLPWLDTSGLALYFLDRLQQLQQCALLPEEVLARLEQNLADNTARTEDMIAESNAIHHGFQDAGLSYAALKGFSLWPCSVPRPELRSQLDLDFLVAETSAAEARRILESRGYRLCAISGQSWEFKANEMRGMSLKDLYKATPHRVVELHIEACALGETSLLDRTVKRCFHGVCMPVLSSVDLFLGQGLHLYKHVSSEFSRAAHLIEFRHHVITRRDDAAFWRDLRSRAADNRRTRIALGLVTLLITDVMGGFAPVEFTAWTVDRLPSSARLWVEHYGRRSVLASFPGTKLYLLLQGELAALGLPAKRSLRQALMPLCLPPAMARAEANETLTARVRRQRTQLYFTLFRLCFHLVEGFRYLRESLRWRQYLNGFAS